MELSTAEDGEYSWKEEQLMVISSGSKELK
jgi:hypothetical protein